MKLFVTKIDVTGKKLWLFDLHSHNEKASQQASLGFMNWNKWRSVFIGTTDICYMLGRVSSHGQSANLWKPTDFCVGVWGWGFGVGESIYCIGVLGVGVLSRDRSPHNFTPITLWSYLLTLKVSACYYHWLVYLKKLISVTPANTYFWQVCVHNQKWLYKKDYP